MFRAFSIHSSSSLPLVSAALVSGEMPHLSRRKFALLSCATLLTPLLTACGDGEKADSQATASVRIGICELMEHEALERSVAGFIEALAERGFVEGKNLIIDRQNAQGDQATLQNIGARFVSEDPKLIFAVSTPALQAMARATREIPIVATAVTSFEAAKVVKSDTRPDTNVTGVSNLGPVERQLELLLVFAKDKKLGVIFNAGEVNSAFQVERFQKAAATKGVEVLTATVSSVNDIQQAVASLSGKVSGLWFPTDNVLAAGSAILARAAMDAKLPTVPGDEALVRNGCLATIAVDYLTLGRMSGAIAADILEGKRRPQETPIAFQDARHPIVNLDTAKALGLTISDAILKNATTIP